MVGRERERRRLRDAFEQAVGDAPVSSSRCSASPASASRGSSRSSSTSSAGQALVARGRCLPYGEGITYWPLLEAVNEAVGLDDATRPRRRARSSLEALGDEDGSELVAQRRRRDDRARRGRRAASRRRFAAVRALFEALARDAPARARLRRHPLGRATFLDLVEHLADWTRDAPILLVCLARPELLEVRPGWGGGKLNATAALLEPLSDDECAQPDRESRRSRRARRRGRGADRRGGRGQPALRRGDAVDADRRRPARSGTTAAGRRPANLGSAGAADDPGAARRAARPARRRRAGRDRAGRGRRQGLPRGSGRRARAGERCDRPSPTRSRPRPQGADPARAAEPRRARRTASATY